MFLYTVTPPRRDVHTSAIHVPWQEGGEGAIGGGGYWVDKIARGPGQDRTNLN